MKMLLQKSISYLMIPFLRQLVQKWMLQAGAIADPIFIFIRNRKLLFEASIWYFDFNDRSNYILHSKEIVRNRKEDNSIEFFKQNCETWESDIYDDLARPKLWHG